MKTEELKKVYTQLNQDGFNIVFMENAFMTKPGVAYLVLHPDDFKKLKDQTATKPSNQTKGE